MTIPLPTHADDRVLVVRDLRRTVDGRRIIPRLSLTLRPRAIVFFIGPSGVGKSTALRLIAGLDPPDPTPVPPVTLRGRAPGDMGLPEWRCHVMLVAQRPATLPGSPADLFHRLSEFGVRAGRSRKVSVEDDYAPVCLRLGLPLERIHDEWTTLSGGEAQRAALAMALALKPEALLLDEVTSALDPEATRVVEREIVEHCRISDTMVLWVSHDSEQPTRVEALAPSTPQIIDFQTLVDEDKV